MDDPSLRECEREFFHDGGDARVQVKGLAHDRDALPHARLRKVQQFFDQALRPGGGAGHVAQHADFPGRGLSMG